MKKNKSKLIPKLRTVTNKNTIFQRRYWVKDSNHKVNSSIQVSVKDFIEAGLKLGSEYYTNIDSLVFAKDIVRTLVPDISKIEKLSPELEKSVNGIYYLKTHHIELSGDILDSLRFALLISNKLKESNNLKFTKKASSNFSDSNSVTFRKFVNNLSTLFHESIHALSKTDRCTRPFEEGLTETLTKFFTPQFLLPSKLFSS